MTFHLRPYQAQVADAVFANWAAGARVVAARIPTGGGKTPTFGAIMQRHGTPAVAIAHRGELLGQMSLALARYGMRHRVIGPDSLQRNCVAIHMAELGRNYVDPNARSAVAGIDTLVRRDISSWAASIGLWVGDEGHHFLRSNKWGKGVEMFPNARGLLVTATLNRPDGKGLGRHADGYADALVNGPELTDLQAMGYLTPCRIYTPKASDLNLDGVGMGADDYSQTALRKAVHQSRKIVGDIVEHYLDLARGKLGITFAVDIEHCNEIAEAYRARGVTAEVITGEDPPLARADKMRRFRARQIMQLVNVDVLGEGVDVPAVEVVSMARPTKSYTVFAQEAGRMLRLMLPPAMAEGWDRHTNEMRRALIAMSPKPEGILIDHVGNVQEHAVARPCAITGGLVIDLCHRDWTLDRQERARRGPPSDAVPLRTCLNTACVKPYPRISLTCPHCGTAVELAERTSPVHVDGILHELHPESLRKLAQAVAHVDSKFSAPANLGAINSRALYNRHAERQTAQATLRDAIAWFCATTPDKVGDLATTAAGQARFFHTMGIDVLSAMALGASDAAALEARIRAQLP